MVSSAGPPSLPGRAGLTETFGLAWSARAHGGREEAESAWGRGSREGSRAPALCFGESWGERGGFQRGCVLPGDRHRGGTDGM